MAEDGRVIFPEPHKVVRADVASGVAGERFLQGRFCFPFDDRARIGDTSSVGKDGNKQFKGTKMRTQVALGLLLMGLACSCAGCLAIAVGAGAAGTVAYMGGDLETDVSEDIDTLYAASRKALDDLELNIIEGRGGKDALSATIVARDAEDKKVQIKLKSISDEMTELSIRVGVFGNETKSQLIYNKILKNLDSV